MSKLSYRIEERINSHHIGGIILLIIGIFAIIFPYLFSRAIIYLVGIALLLAGLSQGFIYFTHPEGRGALLLKSLILISLALVSFFSPVLGLKILTAVLMLFFFFAAITNFMLARSIKTQKGTGMAILVGILSLFLDLLLLLGWAETTQFFIGLFLGVLFIVDGALFLIVGEEERMGVKDKGLK